MGTRGAALDRCNGPTRWAGADLLSFNASNEIVSDEARIDTSTLFGRASVTGPLSDRSQVRDLAVRYTAAWGSQNATSVAAFYAPMASLRINGGTPSIGRDAITATAQEFMTAFPDMSVTMDGLLVHGDQAVYRWTLVGTNTGPGGTGRRVRISGFEVWRIGADGLIAGSEGHFDSGAYERQVTGGSRAP